MNESSLAQMPRSTPGAGESLPDIGGDWLDYMARGAKNHGGVVNLQMPKPLNELVLVTDPRAIERIFIDDAHSYRKPKSQRVLAPLLGTGLLLGEGESWKQHRRIVQPAFHRAKIASYASEMASCAESMVDSWEHGSVRDVFADASALTFRIAVGTLFGAGGGDESEQVRTALAEALRATDNFMDWRRMQRAGAELKAVVDNFIARRRAANAGGDDILAMLLDAREEDGAGLNDQEVRDEAINAFVGGVDTTAISISWTLNLLARHPGVGRQIRDEIASVAGDAPIALEHVSRLKKLEAVTRESLRLYPPAWSIARETVDDTTIGGYRVAAGTQVYTCPYLVHRNPEWFPEPEQFMPERWAGDLVKVLPKFAYFPFGGGQRMCIGAAFAMTELVVVLATVLRRAQLDLTERVADARPSFTLRPRDGIHLRVAQKSQTAS